MADPDPCFTSATELARRIPTREISPVEIVESREATFRYFVQASRVAAREPLMPITPWPCPAA
ncbi:MAG: hypothetical protein GDA49_07435 [Rhodospirillales bacterium]|nr:hypothetical protein [Rhodospirillales bacterium]